MYRKTPLRLAVCELEKLDLLMFVSLLHSELQRCDISIDFFRTINIKTFPLTHTLLCFKTTCFYINWSLSYPDLCECMCVF